jgi:hypothetical protein
MFASTGMNCQSPVNVQSNKVVIYGQEHDGPTTVYEGDLFFGYRSSPATK